jgi:hypothetical protein
MLEIKILNDLKERLHAEFENKQHYLIYLRRMND